MAQEHKEFLKKLLLKDLCTRLPYEVKVKVKGYADACKLLAIYTNGTAYTTRDVGYPIETYFEDCKPYLFPLSSMTKEQEKEFVATLKYLPAEEINFWTLKTYEWSDKNHFDYRGLIPMGLANDATELNIY